MARYCGGTWAHLLVLHALTSMILVSSSPLPTIHQDIHDRMDESEPDEIVQQLMADPPSLPLTQFYDRDPGRAPDASPDAQPPQPMLPEAKQVESSSKEFRQKYRRVKSPVRRMNRVMLLLKTEMGKVQIAIEDVKDECHQKEIPKDECMNQKSSLQLLGKLRRIQSAWVTVQELGKEAEHIQNIEVLAQKDLQNATKYQSKAKTMLSGRIIALKDIKTRIHDLSKEDDKDAKMQTRWEKELKDNWERMEKANDAARVVEAYNIKFGTKLQGVMKGMKQEDDRASEDFDKAEAINERAALLEARAADMENKAKQILEEGAEKRARRDSSSGDARDSVQYQRNEDGILASDSYQPLDSFGKAKAHPTFGAQQFMAQKPMRANEPLMVGKKDELEPIGDGKDELDPLGAGEKSPMRAHAPSKVSQTLMSGKDSDRQNNDDTSSSLPTAADLHDSDYLEDGEIAN